MSERPVTRQDTEAFMAQVQKVIDSGVESATVTVFGTELTLAKDGEAYQVRSSADPTQLSRLFPASPACPAGYPEGIPFIADEAVGVSVAAGDALSMIWWAPRDAERVFAELCGQVDAGGWTLEDEKLMAPVSLHQRRYRKDQLTRHVMLSAGIVSLIQKPNR